MYVKVYVPLMLRSLGTCIHEELFFQDAFVYSTFTH